MPCGLEDRARFFPRLDSLRQRTPGFFDAPATGLAPLAAGGAGNVAAAAAAGGGLGGGGGAAGDEAAFPEVTIAFCAIDK